MGSKYENKEICSKCGGMCCKSAGCALTIDQFKKFNKDTVLELLKTGMATIDWYEGDPRDDFSCPMNELEEKITKECEGIPLQPLAYYIRMREVDDYDFVVGSWGGECIIHKEYGICPLELSYRPGEAVHMIPNEGRTSNDPKVKILSSCFADSDEYAKIYYSARYLPYYIVFEEVIEELFDLDYDNYPFKGQESIDKFKSLIQPTEYTE